jgi:adenylate cyclase
VLVGSSALMLLAAYGLFARAGIWLSPLLPIAGGAWTFVVDTAVGFFIHRGRARETRRAFAQYVPAEVVDRLIEQPELLELGGEERELTLLFSDLANFTGLAEHLPPRAVVGILGQYFDLMSAIIYRHGGTVDKYIGDGIMAFWGAPLPDDRQADHALAAAIEMQTVFAQVSSRLAADKLPQVGMRIGIHTGNVVVGNVGSKARFAYTAIGDAVNLASRLEGANKAYGTAILISEATAQRLGVRSSLRPVDSVVVKGRTDAVPVFTPCDDERLVELSTAALEAYRRGERESSLRTWNEILAAYPDDVIARVFAARINGAPEDIPVG